MGKGGDLFLFTHLTVERCPFLFIYLTWILDGGESEQTASAAEGTLGRQEARGGRRPQPTMEDQSPDDAGQTTGREAEQTRRWRDERPSRAKRLHQRGVLEGPITAHACLGNAKKCSQAPSRPPPTPA